MELIIVPVSLLVGIALVYWGVHGVPGSHQMAYAGSDGRQAPEFRKPPRPRTIEGTAYTVDPPASNLRHQDVLLADLMSEMLDIRSELQELRAKVAELTIDERKAAAKEAKESARPAPRRRAVRASA